MKRKSCLSDFTKEELLEMLDIVHEWVGIDAESLPSKREEVTPEAEEFWQKCQKYRQPLIDYIYRNV